MPTKTLSAALDWIASENYLSSYHDADWGGDDTELLESAQLRRDRLLSYGLSAQGRRSGGAMFIDCYGDRSMETSTTSDKAAAAAEGTWNNIHDYSDMMLGDCVGAIPDQSVANGAGEVTRKSFDSSFGLDDQPTTTQGEQSFLNVRFSYFDLKEASFSE
jgi:hypothetical protein